MGFNAQVAVDWLQASPVEEPLVPVSACGLKDRRGYRIQEMADCRE
jgi:hypothetical protein